VTPVRRFLRKLLLRTSRSIVPRRRQPIRRGHTCGHTCGSSATWCIGKTGMHACRVVWTGNSRGMPSSLTGRAPQQVFYGELSVLDKPTGGSSNLENGQAIGIGITAPEFAERQKGLLAKAPVWLLHGCYVSDSNVTGASRPRGVIGFCRQNTIVFTKRRQSLCYACA
jgi:hypothetical protein